MFQLHLRPHVSTRYSATPVPLYTPESINIYIERRKRGVFGVSTSLAATCINQIQCHPWMKELKGIIHRGEGAFLRCPVSTSIQFSLRDEGSTEYMCVRGKITGDNIYRCQSACPVVLNNFDLFKEILHLRACVG